MYTEDGHTRKVCAPLCTVVRDTCGVNVPVSCQRKLCIPSLAVSSIVLKPLMKVFTLLLTREPLKYRVLFYTPALARGRPKSHADHFLHTMGTDGHLYLAMLGLVTQGRTHDKGRRAIHRGELYTNVHTQRRRCPGKA